MKLIRLLLVIIFLFLSESTWSQCTNISNVEISASNINPCGFPKTFHFGSTFSLDSTPVFLSTQTSVANFQLPFNLDFPTDNNNCTYYLEIIGSYTAWGNHERYDAYCKFNNNINALISVGDGIADDLTPVAYKSPNAYDSLHAYKYYYKGNGTDVRLKFRDSHYPDNNGTASFNWYAIPCFQYHWDFGDGYTSSLQNPVHTYYTPGSYTVSFSISDGVNNCIVTYDTVIQILPSPLANLGESAVICPPQKLKLNPGSFHSYLWQDGSINRTFTVEEPGVYWVSTVDAQGCTSSDTILVEESCFGLVLLPNAFTPNDDGINDIFKAVSIRTKLIQFKMYVFDRFGNKLFESENIELGWDGTFEGKKVANGNYIYKVFYQGIVNNEPFEKNEGGTFVVIK